MLGSALYPYFVRQGYRVKATDINITDDWISHLDVRDTNAVHTEVTTGGYDLVLHLAAETSLEVCEDQPDHAYKTNTFATLNVARACQERDIPMVFISTAGIFDGNKVGYYNEYDRPNPIMVYGNSKCQAETIIREMLSRYFIVRAGWMIGGIQKDKKFVGKIVSQIKQGAKEVFAVGDKFGTPTYVEYFARNLERLVQTDMYNTYHMVCEGHGSRYDVAREILRILKKEKDIKLTQVDSGFFKRDYPVPRPTSEMLENMNLRYIGINLMGSWQDALIEYLMKFEGLA
jgi:dTDP-4-dehydrorhamnose reductase